MIDWRQECFSGHANFFEFFEAASKNLASGSKIPRRTKFLAAFGAPEQETLPELTSKTGSDRVQANYLTWGGVTDTFVSKSLARDRPQLTIMSSFNVPMSTQSLMQQRYDQRDQQREDGLT